MVNHHLTNMALKYTEYDMIEAHTKLPPYPENRTRLLSILLGEDSLNKEHSELCALAASLAQLGLDTHDLVDISDKNLGIEQARSRQLKVLAGDYFNSRFYQLLAHVDRVDVIQLVSKAICEVNRLKMNAYERFQLSQVTPEEYLELSVSIRSELFLAFSPYISSRYKEIWPELLKLIARCEIIGEELSSNHDAGSLQYSWTYWYVLQAVSLEEKKAIDPSDWTSIIPFLNKYPVELHLSQLLNHQIEHLLSFAAQIDSEFISQELYQIVERIKIPFVVSQVAE
jgi:heptaprenyl diphosphate synthase